MTKGLIIATVVVLVCGLLASCAQAFGVQCTQDPISGKIVCNGAYQPATPSTPAPAPLPTPERG